MAIPRLTIIGESINDSVPSTKKLFDENDIPGLLELARSQDEKGAAWIDVNVGARSPEFMADLVRRIQSVTAKPLSIDTPDPAIAEAGLRAYDPERAGGRRPILNSISPLRVQMFDLWAVRPFRPILMASERYETGPDCGSPNRTGQGHASDGPGASRGGPPARLRVRQRPGHHRPRHRPCRQRLRRSAQAGARIPGPDPW